MNKAISKLHKLLTAQVTGNDVLKNLEKYVEN